MPDLVRPPHADRGTGAAFPATAAARARFVLERRVARPHHDPWRHQGVIVEDERAEDGRPARTATIFLTGRECPWRCTMCDLWKYTIAGDTPAGAIPAQIAAARSSLLAEPTPVPCVKLYNAGSFFDPRAVPERDYQDVALALRGLARVIVESHPSLVGSRVDRWVEALERHASTGGGPPQLEVAMGLETAHPGALDRLNKGFTLDGFERASRALARRGAALRVFLLIAPPFVPRHEQDAWLLRSVDAAFTLGASVVSLVPTRTGNGALEALETAGLFGPPTLTDIERSAALALDHAGHRGRVFVDLWDLDRFSTCASCLDARRARLAAMNLQRQVFPLPGCRACAAPSR